MTRSLPTLLLLVLGCREESPYGGAFDMPTEAAVLHPTTGGPFSEPIGFVANQHGGRIVQLALKQGRFLADDPIAAFVRGSWLATGDDRILQGLAVWAPDAGTVHVFAGDARYGSLLRVPYIVGLTEDGLPIEVETQVSEPVFVDVDGEGAEPAVTQLEVFQGFATTETWTLSFSEDVWWATGSRSGREPEPIPPDEPFTSESGAFALTIEGSASFGDRIEFTTDNGIEEIDVGGTPLELAMSPDQSRLAVVVQDREEARPVLRWVDPVSGEPFAETPLPEDASPERITWSEDGEVLFVADSGTAAVWAVSGDSPGDAVAYELPWPTFDVAHLSGEDGDRLYLAPITGREVWLLDLATGELVDVNPWLEGTQGLPTHAVVQGLEAIPVPYRWPEVDNDGVNLRGRSVGLSLFPGTVVFMEEETGCLVRDEFGPRVTAQEFGTAAYETNFDAVAGAAYLELNTVNGRPAQVNPCGGIAPAETWVLRYDRTVQGWRVEGTISGEQENIAFEDLRYVSDGGEVSFVVRAGTTPSEDGWRMSFEVTAGVVVANGDADGDGDAEVPLENLGDPVFFVYDVGPTDGGWDFVDRRPFLLVTSTGTDAVGRVEPQTGDFEVGWN